MYSIRSLYRIGRGPSASHTIGPARAATIFREHYPQAGMYRVQLQGSLAATGRGHMTDLAVEQALAPAAVTIDWQPDLLQEFHPNGILFQALDEAGGETGGGRCLAWAAGNWLKRSRLAGCHD
jgi:L-serine dehydratase